MHLLRRCIRDYIYIDDVVRGIQHILNSDLCGVFNLGTGIGTSVAEIVKIAEKISPNHDKTEYVEVQNEDHSKVVLDVLKLAKAGFKTEISFEEGLTKMVRESERK